MTVQYLQKQGLAGVRKMSTKEKQTVSPGNKVPKSGQYMLVGPRGGKKNHETALVKGKTVPPTPQQGQHWELTDATNNKSGKGT